MVYAIKDVATTRMSARDDDLLLAQRIAAGDQDATSEFDRNHRRDLERLATAVGMGQADAQDLAQDALIASINLIRDGRYRGDGSLRTLLCAILRRKIVDFRRQQSSRAISRVQPEEGGRLDVEELVGPPMFSDSRLMAEQALKSLPAEHRLILLLNQMGGHTIEQIAAMIGRSRGRVGAMLAEAKRMFRKSLS